MNFLLGCDPELFVTQQGQLVSAHGLIEGDKENPFPVEHGAVQVDGMALEFNIDPAKTKGEFAANIHAVMDSLQAMVPEYELQATASVHFDKELLDSLPEEATELGCDPDYNAYTEKTNPTPDASTTLRTAAGHVHIGWTEGQIPEGIHFDACVKLVKELDVTLGLMSVILDKDKERRELYGKAGAFRCKEYGVEYRVLSNFWLTNDILIDWVYDQIDSTMKRMSEGKLYSPEYGEAARKIIDTSDVAGAYELAFGLGLEFPKGYVHEV
jgi:hypothetical protein